jgi:hypothetical protein
MAWGRLQALAKPPNYLKSQRERNPRMRSFLWAATVGGMVVWIISLRQRLQAAEMRGDMYRDIAARLDRQIADFNDRGR